LLVVVVFAGMVNLPVAAQTDEMQFRYNAAHTGILTGSDPSTHADIANQVMNVTVPFVENHGQTDDRVTYYATTFYGTSYVTQDGITHSIQGMDNRTLVLTEQFVDANGTPVTLHPQGEEPSATVVSYFTGNDPDKWQTNLPTFNIINLGELYPGVTVKLRASGSNVEKLFFVNPGANVDDIKIKIRGADHLTIDSAGQLVIASSGFEDVSISKPNAFQDSKNYVTSTYDVTDAWSIQSKPVGSTVALSSTTAAKPTFTPDKAGDYVFALNVTDSLGLKSTKADTVKITATATPTVTPSPSPTVTPSASPTVSPTVTPSVSPTVTPTTSPTPTVKPSPEFPLAMAGAGMMMLAIAGIYAVIRRRR